ncbi:hypothetical protein HDU91_004200 [Kappamyces sp. JEL0680]|nr:hypothetical protein HDU91_004200 [Kappamyces sp. JEL0680]
MGHLILALAGADLIDSTAKAIGRAGPDSGLHSALCKAQTAMVLEGDVVSVLLAFWFSLLVVYVTTSKRYYSVSKSQETFIIAMSYLFPVPFWVFTIFSSSWFNADYIVADSNAWCYIAGNLFYPYQFWFYYCWQWITFLFNVAAIVMVWFRLKEMEEQIAAVTGSTQSSRRILFVVERMIAFLVAFFVGHIFSNINRIYTALGNPASYTLLILHSAISPARGMLNFMAFLYTYYTSPARRSFGSGGSTTHSRISSRESSFILKGTADQDTPKDQQWKH